ncbi:MAG TPA: beta-propeller domain-containing protein [Acidimicrobiales bacterium]|nr:beta-propeller domain-containing protein [Acidimicrobiales bacterium]
MKLIGILAAMLLVVGLAVSLGDAGDRTTPFALGDVRLVSVESCDELLDWYQSAAATTDPAALGGFGFAVGGGREMFATDDAAAETSSGAATTSAPAPQRTAADGDSFSGTNIQERGVDEPDVVKTDGDVIYAVGYGGVRVVDVGDGEPRLLTTIPIEDGAGELLLSGDRLLVMTGTWREDPSASQPGSDDARLMIAPAGSQVTVLTSVDVSDPSNPRVLETRELPGGYRSARATGDVARIVLVNMPHFPQPGPAVWESNDPAVLEQWRDAAVSSMTLEDWAPAVGDDCSSVARTSEPQGVSTTTVLTLDLQGSLAELDSDSVVADAGTIYASTDQLVIATSRWQQWSQPAGEVRTELHAFDITDPAQTTYTGSGEVSGYLLNQFALSAHGGHLRVATTDDAPWDEATGVAQTHSGITVLDGALQQVGRIEGLGVTERIFAVRYLGDIAYVVTFRQTDPLYVIDLSDPTAPRLAGELKIPGYSAYLHPIDDGRLLGVGQDADDDGRVLGTQVSTFDVSDPSAPTQVDKVTIANGSSGVEWDHRAFLWWGATRTAVIPVEIYDGRGVAIDCPPNADCVAPDFQQPYSGAVAFGVSGDGSIVERGRVSHQPYADPNAFWPAVQRSVIVGDALYTISEAGVLKSDLASLSPQGYAAFPAPDYEDRPVGIAVPEPAPTEG